MSKQMISKGSEINFPASKILSSNVLFVPTILLTVSQRSKSDPFNLSRSQHLCSADPMENRLLKRGRFLIFNSWTETNDAIFIAVINSKFCFVCKDLTGINFISTPPPALTNVSVPKWFRCFSYSTSSKQFLKILSTIRRDFAGISVFRHW